MKSRRYRLQTGKIALEGPNLVEEALKAGLEPEIIFATVEYKEGGGYALLKSLPGGVKQAVLPKKLFVKMAATESPQEIAAIFYYRQHPAGDWFIKKQDPLLILDRLQDPGNLGTLIRTAAAAGMSAVYLVAGGADPFGPKTLRASAGAVFQIPLIMINDPALLISTLKSKGIQIIGTDAGSPLPYWEADYTRPTAVVIGNEAAGILPELFSTVDCSVAIPLYGNVESLNAAAAGAVIVYEIMRQRRA
ncbi:MAG: RNA methyltransferase [Bacillota bacterium]|nr:RNA methyltransferase [Bacillota bacterium]